MTPNPARIRTSHASQSDGARVAEALLLEHPHISAAICYQDVVALG